MKITIKLLSDLCTCSGETYNSVVDMDVVYDENGIPYIPAKRIKGCIREAALEMKERFIGLMGQEYPVVFGTFHSVFSRILRAEAQKQKMIKEAEGQAAAILKVQQANADGIKFLNEAAPDQAVLTLKSLEAFAKAADGKATKLIIPSEISGIAGLASSLTEIVTKNSES